MTDTTDSERRRKARAASARYRAKNKEKISERERNYRIQNKAKVREIQRKSRAKHPETDRAYAKRYRARNRAKLTEANRKWRLAHPGYDRELQNRRNREKSEFELGRPRPAACEVCARSSRQIVFDHCHQKGHARGWLCQACNTILGLASDDSAILLKLAAYLHRTKAMLPRQLAIPGV